MQANYYRLVKVRRKFGFMFDENGNEIDEKERGLIDFCPAISEAGKAKCHEWLMFKQEAGQKQYLKCIECNLSSHF